MSRHANTEAVRDFGTLQLKPDEGDWGNANLQYHLQSDREIFEVHIHKMHIIHKCIFIKCIFEVHIDKMHIRSACM